MSTYQLSTLQAKGPSLNAMEFIYDAYVCFGMFQLFSSAGAAKTRCTSCVHCFRPVNKYLHEMRNMPHGPAKPILFCMRVAAPCGPRRGVAVVFVKSSHVMS